jgi:WD and tetratricopeptide repeat-containing protein 1
MIKYLFRVTLAASIVYNGTNQERECAWTSELASTYHFSLLASGSDDQRIVIWNAFGYRQLASFHTGHRNNIFSVQFVPYTNDDLLLTCAGDNTVRLHSMKARDIDRCIHFYECHTARVKRLAVTAASPHLFWSAGEDGLVL